MDDKSAAASAVAQARLATIREDISSRLRSVNQGMSSVEFNALMDQMALLQLKFEQRAAEEMVEIDRRIGEADRRADANLLRLRGLSTVEEAVPDTETR